MQRIIIPKAFSGRKALIFTRRSLSSLPQQSQSSLQHNEASLPKMPPFDYTPPPYTGPSAEEIFKKRKEYLNPAIFHFYKDPVRI